MFLKSLEQHLRTVLILFPTSLMLSCSVILLHVISPSKCHNCDLYCFIFLFEILTTRIDEEALAKAVRCYRHV